MNAPKPQGALKNEIRIVTMAKNKIPCVTVLCFIKWHSSGMQFPRKLFGWSMSGNNEPKAADATYPIPVTGIFTPYFLAANEIPIAVEVPTTTCVL